MNGIERRSSRRPSRIDGPLRIAGAVGISIFVLNACTASQGSGRSPSVVYEHERFGSPEIRTPQLRN